MDRPARPAPPRRLPIVYFALGHAALFTALLVPALAPRTIDTFFYHSRMFFVVHLVTLGWITHSILGATYLVAPMALRATLTTTKAVWASTRQRSPTSPPSAVSVTSRPRLIRFTGSIRSMPPSCRP